MDTNPRDIITHLIPGVMVVSTSFSHFHHFKAHFICKTKDSHDPLHAFQFLARIILFISRRYQRYHIKFIQQV